MFFFFLPRPFQEPVQNHDAFAGQMFPMLLQGNIAQIKPLILLNVFAGLRLT
jgi:hypothetical protein